MGDQGGERTEGRGTIEKLKASELSQIDRLAAVMSGKGGVGKSSVTALLAVRLSRQGFRVGIMDADITGPSIPRMFGVREQPASLGFGILPVRTRTGISIMSLNLLLPHEDDPVIWRGPLIAGAVRQFWTDVAWGELDYLLVDLPPGTGDAPLTVMQSLPLDGLVVVSSPQDLAVMVVRKAIKMAGMLGVPILGLLENMTYATCPRCGEKLRLFGPSQGERVARETGVPFLGEIPLDPHLAELCDSGEIEQYEGVMLPLLSSLLPLSGKE
ncbi:MAG: Mrp/NBP35 family ATP-binding protein [Firmicutes bacterium]|nr:Mrp/NBP35 family ATP-binding protein [Bacillota bacterium]